MAAFLMSRTKIDAVVTGADRVAANGDAANKIGTYGLAMKHHGVPFYIAAPLSPFDANCPCGAEIPIEERAADEVRKIGGQYITPPDVKVWNPAFDVTPSELITGIITERGVIRAPYKASELIAGIITERGVIRAPYKENIEKIFPGGNA